MKAVLFKNKTLSIVEKPIPKIADGEVLIRPTMVGICNTDIELFEGYYGFEGIAGHEFVGIIERSPGQPQLEGKRVVADINCGCGECSWCRAGNKRHCFHRKVIGIREWDGAFAEYLKAPLSNIRLVDEEISDEEAVFVEPLAAALEINRQIHITPTAAMMVLGDGKLGLLIALALRHSNPGILLVGKHEAKLAIAQRQGVRTLHIESPDILSRLPETLGLFDIVVEATGDENGISHALPFVRPEGTLVAKTTSHLPSQIHLAKIVVDEIRLIGSRCGDFDPALAFLKNKWIDVRPLIEAAHPFDEFGKAFDQARRRGTKKILVKISPPPFR